MILFNVYGASLTLEVLHLLKDGGVRKVFLIGSMFAKRISVGTLVLPVKVIDKAGIVSLDQAGTTVVPNESSVTRIKLALRRSNQRYEKLKIVSVPCVLHTIKSVRRFVQDNADVGGVEMETSTFLHFSRKLRMTSYAVLYVSDTERVDVISGSRAVREARRHALRNITKIALELL